MVAWEALNLAASWLTQRSTSVVMAPTTGADLDDFVYIRAPARN